MSLRLLPTEVRLIIFHELCTNWNGRVPNIIKALRPDSELYHEALEELYCHNVFVAHKGNGWSFGDMTKNAVLSIRKAKILVESGIMHEGLWEIKSYYEDYDIVDPACTPATIADAINIRELEVNFKAERESEDVLPHVIFGRTTPITFPLNFLAAPFKFLKRLELVLPRRPVPSELYVYLLRERKFSFGIMTTNSIFKTAGKLKTVPAFHYHHDVEGRVTASELNTIADLEAADRWFWVPDGDWYLGEDGPRPEQAHVESKISCLTLNDKQV